MSHQFFHESKINKYGAGVSMEVLTDQRCTCKVCHSPDTPRRMDVYEVAMGCCVTCLGRHEQLDTTPEPMDRAANDARLLAAAGVPMGYRRMDFESWKGKVQEPLMGWTGRPGWCIYLYGGTGAGKTHLAVATAQRWLRRGEEGVRFWLVSELLRQLKEEFDTGSKVLEAGVRVARLLVLDDVFAERGTEWARSTVFDLLRHRHSEAAPTVLTSNLAPGEVAALDASIMSRLYEGHVIQLTRPDYRFMARREGG